MGRRGTRPRSYFRKKPARWSITGKDKISGSAENKSSPWHVAVGAENVAIACLGLRSGPAPGAAANPQQDFVTLSASEHGVLAADDDKRRAFVGLHFDRFPLGRDVLREFL